MNKTPEHPHVVLIAWPEGAGKTALAGRICRTKPEERVGEAVGCRRLSVGNLWKSAKSVDPLLMLFVVKKDNDPLEG
jgi:DNA helicase TIP49 (TBP-interacting protein)